MRFVAVIGDVVGSRHIRDRRPFQSQFAAATADLNRQRQLLSPYTITLGDEVQALYSDGSGLFRDLFYLAAALEPRRIRFSVGIGSLTTPVNRHSAIGMDGPAFHRAREGIESLREGKGLFVIVGSGSDDFAPENEALRLLSHICWSWRSTRWRVLQLLVRNRPKSAIATQLGITQAAVYKSIQAGALDVVIQLGDRIGDRVSGSVETDP